MCLFPRAGRGPHQPQRRDDTVRYQCCIHPWMRLVVDDNDDHGHRLVYPIVSRRSSVVSTTFAESC